MDQDLAAIHQLVAAVDELQTDADRYTQLLTDDVVIVNFGGRLVRGRERFHEAMGQALATPLADVITRTEIEHVGFLRPDVALVTARKHIADNRAGDSNDGDTFPTTGVLTLVLVKDDADWRIAKAQTTPVVVG